MLVVAAVVLLGGCGEGAAPTAKSVTSARATGMPTAAFASQSPAVQGDIGPHEAENNGWKHRDEPTTGDRATAEALAARLRPALERLRRARDVSPDATRAAVLLLGVAQDRLDVVALGQGLLATPPPGAVVGVYVGATACVVGDVRPERSRVEVLGRAAEFGCLEPSSH